MCWATALGLPVNQLAVDGVQPSALVRWMTSSTSTCAMQEDPEKPKASRVYGLDGVGCRPRHFAAEIVLDAERFGARGHGCGLGHVEAEHGLGEEGAHAIARR